MKETITIPSSILTDDTLSASEKLIEIYVLGTTEIIFPHEIMQTLKMSKNTVYNALNKFAKRGLLKFNSRFKVYYLAKQTDGENGG